MNQSRKPLLRDRTITVTTELMQNIRISAYVALGGSWAAFMQDIDPSTSGPLPFAAMRMALLIFGIAAALFSVVHYVLQVLTRLRSSGVARASGSQPPNKRTGTPAPPNNRTRTPAPPHRPPLRKAS